MPDPRVGVRLSVKLSTGNYGSVGLEFSEERDVSTLSTEKQTRLAILERLTQECEDWKKGIENPKPTPKLVQGPDRRDFVTSPDAKPPPIPQPEPIDKRSVAGVTEQDLEGELDQLHWMENKNRTGWFAPIEELSFTVKAALVNRFNAATGKSVRIGGYNYTRFGEDNGLIGKFAAKVGQ